MVPQHPISQSIQLQQSAFHSHKSTLRWSNKQGHHFPQGSKLTVPKGQNPIPLVRSSRSSAGTTTTARHKHWVWMHISCFSQSTNTGPAVTGHHGQQAESCDLRLWAREHGKTRRGSGWKEAQCGHILAAGSRLGYFRVVENRQSFTILAQLLFLWHCLALVALLLISLYSDLKANWESVIEWPILAKHRYKDLKEEEEIYQFCNFIPYLWSNICYRGSWILAPPTSHRCIHPSRNFTWQISLVLLDNSKSYPQRWRKRINTLVPTILRITFLRQFILHQVSKLQISD